MKKKWYYQKCQITLKYYIYNPNDIIKPYVCEVYDEVEAKQITTAVNAHEGLLSVCKDALICSEEKGLTDLVVGRIKQAIAESEG